MVLCISSQERSVIILPNSHGLTTFRGGGLNVYSEMVHVVSLVTNIKENSRASWNF